MDTQASLQDEKRITPLYYSPADSQSAPVLSNKSFEEVVSLFDPIGLQDMQEVSLLDRVDQKFIMTQKQMLILLESLRPDYRVLTISGNCLNHYRTIYFDSTDFSLFRMHVNENAERYKVRYREYVDSLDSFLEVKYHTRKDRTVKERIPVFLPYAHLTPDMDDWLNEAVPFDCRCLEPKLTNSFTRITLVNKTSHERVTLDTNLVFFTDQQFIRVDGLAVAEVKSDIGHHASPILSQLKTHKIKPQSFSKYCIGVALLYEEVKKNTLKAKFLTLRKMLERADEGVFS